MGRKFSIIKNLLLAGIIIVAGVVKVTQPVTVHADAALDFTPHRKCTVNSIPSNAVYFSSGNLVTAVAALQSNSTMVIRAGDYSVSSSILINANKTNITICADPGTRPKIYESGNVEVFAVTSASYVHIEGLEIYSTVNTAHNNVSGVVVKELAHHVEVWDVWAHELPACGICSSRSQGHNDFRYNRIWNTANLNRYHQSGISLFENQNGAGGNDANGYSDYLVGNMIWNVKENASHPSDGNCIILDYNKDIRGVPAYTGKFLVVNNLCVANGGRGVHSFHTDNVDVVNNTLYHDLRSGFDGLQGELDASLSSNINFVNNLSIAIPNGNAFDNWGMGSNVVLASNLFSGPVKRPPLSGFSMITDPQFVNPNDDPRIGDFRLKPTSPAVNAGLGTYSGVVIPTVDFNGNTRSLTNPSIGAFEQ